MKKVTQYIAASSLALSNVLCIEHANADGLYIDVGSAAVGMFRYEQGANGVIWLMNDGSPRQIANDAGQSCNITQVMLTPPPGQEKTWLAMVIAATLAGKKIDVVGTCNQASFRIDANRLITEYR